MVVRYFDLCQCNNNNKIIFYSFSIMAFLVHASKNFRVLELVKLSSKFKLIYTNSS